MGPFVDPTTILALLMMILSSGLRDLASALPSDDYWNAKSVVVSPEQLTRELDTVKPDDITKWIGELDADDPKARDEASARIAAVGPSAIPALKDAAQNGSPELVARANALSGKILATPKAASIRRLMAIRTLGERKETAALPALQALVNSTDSFEADYAKAAIAKIQGKDYTFPVATDAERTSDVNLLPARLDLVLQLAPSADGILSIDKLLDQAPVPQEQKAKSKQEANTEILNLLESVGNVRLNAVTWGFFAAPPGVPGNTMVILRGNFDPASLSASLSKDLAAPKKEVGADVWQIGADQALLLTPDGRVILMAREAGGELELDKMLLALKKGAGDFSDNPDLPKLVKSVDTKSPLWAVTKMAAGLKEIVGPLGEFDTATLVAGQSMDHDKRVTEIQLQAIAADPTKAKQVVESVQAELKTAIEEGRKEEPAMPFLKPTLDFAESIKLEVDGGKATVHGSLRDMPMLTTIFMMSRRGLLLPR